MRRFVLTGLLLAALATPAAAQTKVKIMVGGIDKQIYLPAKLADQLGFFKEQGLDAELFNSNSGSQAATALLLPARSRRWSASTTTRSTCSRRASSSPTSSSSSSPPARRSS